MKRVFAIILAIVAFILIMASISHAVEKDNGLPLIPNDWNKTDTALQVTFVTLMAIDRYQTSQIRDINLEEVGWARNFTGSHPTSGQINRYFYTCVGLHTAISMAIPKDWKMFDVPVRNVWQIFWIGVEVNTVYKNYQIGLQYRFF